MATLKMFRRLVPSLCRPLTLRKPRQTQPRKWSTFSEFQSSQPETEKIADYIGTKSRFTTELRLSHMPPEGIQIYRITDATGALIAKEQDPMFSEEKCVKMYKTMILLREMDNILFEAQSIKKMLSFYITSEGEEGVHIGSASALDPQDLVFAQYRETGVLMWRGFTVFEFMNQCFSNHLDRTAKGRQMPTFYGAKDLHFVTTSPPLATQMPQATGAAYAYKRARNGRIVVCYFGEGTASEGDAHAAFNFAAIKECPVLFFCRNNGYSLQTPTHEQYIGDGIAGRAIGYGMSAIRVDGNDVLAVHNAVTTARRIILTESRPVLIEAMTYRTGPHTTAEDTRVEYRGEEEIEKWRNQNNPFERFRHYLAYRGFWNESKETQWIEDAKTEVAESLQRSSSLKKPKPETLFTDVYDVMPKHLKRQMEEMKSHVRRHRDHYPLDKFCEMDDD